MRINIKPSFERIYKKLPRLEQAQINEKILELFNYYNKDMMFADLRVRKLSGKDNYFEINTASNRRILLRKHSDLIELIAYGNHDEIRRLLRQL
jgi:mRNA-degrading endonuclease RelE of RelBE toxin-antitoxin system